MKRRITVNPGERNGRLVVIGESHRNRHGLFLCVKCDCGTVKSVGASNFKKTVSCGCFRRENTSKIKMTHGYSKRYGPEHYLYELWNGIKRRCYCKGDTTNYPRYGGRGIGIYPAWRRDFVAFRKWIIDNLGHRPDASYSMDRINVNGNYEPGNMRWANYNEQARNRRSSYRLKWGTGRITLVEFCERFRLNYEVVRMFLSEMDFNGRMDWSLPPPSVSVIPPTIA